MPEITQPLYGEAASAVGKALHTETSAVRVARRILANADALDLTTASEGALIGAVAGLSEALRMVLEAGTAA